MLLVGILFCLVGECFYYASRYLPFSKNEYLFPATPEIEFIQKNIGDYRLSPSNTIPANMWVPYGLSSPDGYDTTMPLLNFEYYSLLQNQQFSSTAKRAISMENEKSPLYQNLSVKYKITLGNEPVIDSQKSKTDFFTVFSGKNTIVQENKKLLNKIRFIENIVFVKDKLEFRDISPQTDFAKTAIIYQKDASDFQNLDSSCSSKNSQINLIQSRDGYFNFDTSNNCSQLVFISNSFYPGWQATIDGQSTKIYQTNHAFQSILVPAGEHQVKLTYIPSNFKLAIFLTLSSSIILLLILIYGLKKR